MSSLKVCQFCGVSFHIGRTRCPNEPKEAAWSPIGDGFVGGDFEDCDSDSCKWIERPEREARDQFPDGLPTEHLAGTGCTLLQAYSGARISAEEMMVSVLLLISSCLLSSK